MLTMSYTSKGFQTSRTFLFLLGHNRGSNAIHKFNYNNDKRKETTLLQGKEL